MIEERGQANAALANECAIAFGNLRASLLASAHLLAEKDPGDLPLARELVASHLAQGLHLASLDARRSVREAARDLEALCVKAEALLKANRRRAGSDDALAAAARRLDADLCIARGVVRAVPQRASERDEGAGDRASDLPPDPARRSTG